MIGFIILKNEIRIQTAEEEEVKAQGEDRHLQARERQPTLPLMDFISLL